MSETAINSRSLLVVGAAAVGLLAVSGMLRSPSRARAPAPAPARTSRLLASRQHARSATRHARGRRATAPCARRA